MKDFFKVKVVWTGLSLPFIRWKRRSVCILCSSW